MEFVLHTLVIGVGATAVLDLWGVFLKRVFSVPSADWAMVGRWFGHFPRGRFAHDNIAQSPAVRGELIIGWTAHYAIGIVYAGLLLAIWGLDWARRPTLWAALIISWLALVAPFLLMQPGMGAGIAARKTPRPNATRLRSFAAHTVFGVGLYVTALAWARLSGS